MNNQHSIVHSLACYALIFACALVGTQTANAQSCQRAGLLGRIFRVQCCQRSYSCRWSYCQSACSSCQDVPQTTSGCPSCANGTCSVDSSGTTLVDPVEPNEEFAPGISATEETPEVENELSEIEKELVKEAIRVRGRFLSIDRLCCQRSRYNSNAQASYCQLGHYTGDSNEIAGVGYGSARAAIQGWLNSPAHRAILLRANYTKVGASVRRGRDGLLYWTMNFGY